MAGQEAKNDGKVFKVWSDFARTILKFFAINKQNYPDIRVRTDAITVLVMALAYTSCWVNYFWIYGFIFDSRIIAATCLFPGLPTSLIALYILKQKQNIPLASFFANTGGVTSVLLIAILTGGSWSNQLVWCFAGVLATFLVQSARAGMAMTLYAGGSLAIIGAFVTPQPGDAFGWDFPFTIFSEKHAYFNAITHSTGALLVGILAYTFKTRQANALLESEKLREEADQARLRAEKLTEQVEEHARDIRSMLDNTRLGLLSVLPDFSVHKDYARYVETIVESQRIAGNPFETVLLEKSELGPDERNRVLTAMEYALGEDSLFFEANASAFPREITLAISEQKRKNIDIDWVPVVNAEGTVEKILVSLVDVTETLKLRAEAEAGRRNMQYVAELIDLGPRRFASFSETATETWRALDEISQRSTESRVWGEADIREAYIQLHTLKGVTRLYNLKELTDFIHSAEEILTQKKQLTPAELESFHHYLAACKQSHQSYKDAMKPLLSMVDQLQTAAADVEVFSIHALCQNLQESADRLAKDLGKLKCPLVADLPQHTLVEKHFFKALSDSMIHILRNSLDHGIESPEERLQKGLDAHGKIRLFLDSKGNLGIQDDGRGLNIVKLKAKAEAMGRAAADITDVVELIFESGVSTKQSADDISGRGVGMDAVRSFLQKVGSDIRVVPLQQEGDYLKFYFAIPLPEMQNEKLRKAS